MYIYYEEIKFEDIKRVLDTYKAKFVSFKFTKLNETKYYQSYKYRIISDFTKIQFPTFEASKEKSLIYQTSASKMTDTNQIFDKVSKFKELKLTGCIILTNSENLSLYEEKIASLNPYLVNLINIECLIIYYDRFKRKYFIQLQSENTDFIMQKMNANLGTIEKIEFESIESAMIKDQDFDNDYYLKVMHKKYDERFGERFSYKNYCKYPYKFGINEFLAFDVTYTGKKNRNIEFYNLFKKILLEKSNESDNIHVISSVKGVIEAFFSVRKYIGKLFFLSVNIRFNRRILEISYSSNRISSTIPGLYKPNIIATYVLPAFAEEQKQNQEIIKKVESSLDNIQRLMYLRDNISTGEEELERDFRDIAKFIYDFLDENAVGFYEEERKITNTLWIWK